MNTKPSDIKIRQFKYRTDPKTAEKIDIEALILNPKLLEKADDICHELSMFGVCTLITQKLKRDKRIGILDPETLTSLSKIIMKTRNMTPMAYIECIAFRITKFQTYIADLDKKNCNTKHAKTINTIYKKFQKIFSGKEDDSKPFHTFPQYDPSLLLLPRIKNNNKMTDLQ